MYFLLSKQNQKFLFIHICRPGHSDGEAFLLALPCPPHKRKSRQMAWNLPLGAQSWEEPSFSLNEPPEGFGKVGLHLGSLWAGAAQRGPSWSLLPSKATVFPNRWWPANVSQLITGHGQIFSLVTELKDGGVSLRRGVPLTRAGELGGKITVPFKEDGQIKMVGFGQFLASRG